MRARNVAVRLGVGGGGGNRSYSITVGDGVISTLGAVRASLFPRARSVFLIADEGLPSTTIEAAQAALRSGVRVHLATLAPSEADKSIETVQRLVTHMTAARMERAEPVVALGGGIVGDVAGFAAAIYRRGVPIIQCPTTLLAMVDASVGGKTGVNLDVPGPGGVMRLRKNMLGVFHQPAAVLCDVAVLDSLADDEFASGLAECVKHALLGPDWNDAGLLDWIRASAPGLRAREHTLLAELVARNVAIKAAVVEGDEREERTDGRGRMSLNMGHTVGHAIETMEAHAVIEGAARAAPGLKHGEAVALGLIAEAACGEALGVTRPGLSREIGELLGSLGLPTRIEGSIAYREVVNAMFDDKKVGGGKLRLAIPTGHAAECCVVVSDPNEDAIRAGLSAIGI